MLDKFEEKSNVPITYIELDVKKIKYVLKKIFE